jgi:hypothetical protein
MENWTAVEEKPDHPNDLQGSARYALFAGERGNDPTKEQIRAVVLGKPSYDRQDDLLVLEKCLDTLIAILTKQRSLVQQRIEDRRLVELGPKAKGK